MTAESHPEVDLSRAPAGLPEDLFRQIEEVSGLGTWVWNPRSNVVAWSDQVHRIFGTDPADENPTFESYAKLVHPDDVEQVLTRARDAVRSGSSYAIEHRIIRPDGETREVHSKGYAELDADGQVTLLAGSFQDVTSARKASRELATARDLFAGVLDAATEQSIVGMDQDGIITVFNKGAERMLGYRASELVGRSSPLILHDPGEIARRAAELHIPPDFMVLVGSAAQGRAETRRWTYVTKDGRRLQAMITASAMHGPDGRVTGFIKVGTDLTARFVAERALQDSEALFQEIFDNAGSGIMLVDIAHGGAHLMRVNPAMTRITGFSKSALLEMSVFELTHPDSLAPANVRMAQYFADGGAEPASAERRWIHADGRDIWVQLDISPTRRDHPNSVVAVVCDITARKLAERRLSHLALHDALTGLPNRRLLFDRLQHALDGSLRSGRSAGVLYLDLDGFKSVNDQEGHLVGDEILKIAAQRLVGNVRPGDTVARMGGDEFVVLCPDLAHPDDVGIVARRLLWHLAVPYTHGASTHHLSASIGIASAAAGVSAQAVVREADEAMYQAKRGGRNQIRCVDRPADAGGTLAAGRLAQLGADLQGAVERNELVLHGQPILDLDTGAVVAVETLIRWEHPSRGLLLPADFLDVAEVSSMMPKIGREVLTRSCQMAAAWPVPAARAAPSVHVNISGRQLDTGHLCEDVVQALTLSGLPAQRLVLELKESIMSMLTAGVLGDLAHLRREGVRLAVDDIGTGDISLDRLARLPVSVVKIDRLLVARMGQDPATDAVIKALVVIGEALGLQIVAGGVETRTQAQLLHSSGCRTAQGFLYSMPRPAQELLDLFNDDFPWASMFDGVGEVEVQRCTEDEGRAHCVV